jgi:Flp pilus assembly protein TadG
MYLIQGFWREKTGAAAVEFAAVSVVFVLTVLFIMTISVILYINQTLDYATGKVSRQIMLGSAQTSALTRAGFKASLCSYLPSALNCEDLIINLYIVPPGSSPSAYYNYVTSDRSGLMIPSLSGSAGQFNLGAAGQYQYLQVIYPIRFMPRVFAQMLSGAATYQGQSAYLAISTAAFRNEQYSQ